MTYEGEDMGSEVAWFEITGSNPVALEGFYGALFGWSMQPMGDGYSLVDTKSGEGAIGGGIGAAQGPSGAVSVYVKVDDLQAYLERVAELGGHVILPPVDLPEGYGQIAKFADPD